MREPERVPHQKFFSLRAGSGIGHRVGTYDTIGTGQGGLHAYHCIYS